MSAPVFIEVKNAKSKRSVAQNSLLWLWMSVIQKHMAEHFGEIASAEEWHMALVSRILPCEPKIVNLPDSTEVLPGRQRTSKMSAGEFSEYLNLLEAYCADKLGLIVPRPDDLYWAAILNG